MALVNGAGSLERADPAIGTMLGVAAGALAVVGGALLLLGFFTPIAGVASGLAVLLLGGALPRVFVGIVALAVVLLGPGAFSVDSRLFGRREIVIPLRKNAW